MLIAANLAAWGWALITFHDKPVLLGTAFLAYSFGLRHAVDADHIAAIDNVTRKLMQEGKKPLTVGLFFSLGHSTVVVLASIGIAITAMGVPLLDNLHLEALSDACREEGRYEFLFTVNPLNIPTGTGSPVNPTAIF